MTYKLPSLKETIEKFEELGRKEERLANITKHLDPEAYYARKYAAAQDRMIARWLQELADIRCMVSDGEVAEALLSTVTEDEDAIPN